MTRPGIEPRFPGPLANTLPTGIKILNEYYTDKVFTQPLRHKQDATQGQFLRRVYLVWIKSFFF